MRIKGSIVYALSLASLLTLSGCSSPADAEAYAQKSMVRVTAFHMNEKIRSGVGFILGQEGLVLTPYDTIDGATRAVAQMPDGEEIQIKAIQNFSDRQGLAVLEIEKPAASDDGIQLSEKLLVEGAFLVRFMPDGSSKSEKLELGKNLEKNKGGYVVSDSGEPGLLLDGKGRLLGYISGTDTDEPASIVPTRELVAEHEPVGFDDVLKQRAGGAYYGENGVYTGELRGGLPDGLGVYRFKNGDIYEGAHRDGAPDGYGDYMRADGGHYEGFLRGGLFEGEGVYVFTDGSRYEGAFRAGMRDGYGAQFDADGNTVREGMWQEDKPLMPYRDLFKLSVEYNAKPLSSDDPTLVKPGSAMRLFTEYPESQIAYITWYFDSENQAVRLESNQSQTSIIIPFSMMPGSSHVLYAELESADGQKTGWVSYPIDIVE